MRRGFTLIELLAVIVILAIIALITIPAVLKMTDNAKVSSYRRSIDLYGRAINAAIAAYQSDKIEKKEPYQVTFSNVEAYVDYEGNDINCKVSKIYSDDTILLTECSVEGNLVYAEKEKGYGSNNYYYYTNSKKRIRVLEYVNGVNKALKEREFTANTCQVKEDGNLLCNGETIEITSNLEKPISGTITIQNNKVISYSQLKFKDKKIETQEEIPTIVDEGEINTEESEIIISDEELMSLSPGLYDKDKNLLATWDELINNYGLDLSRSNYTAGNSDGIVNLEKILKNNPKLEDARILIVGDGTTLIGNYAFANCKKLTNIIIPNSVTKIGYYAFANCVNLRTISLSNVTEIMENAFYQCSKLEKVIFSDNLVKIDLAAFYNCNSLTNIIIPSSVTSIGGSAFYGCSSLKSISIPASVTSIQGNPFQGCSGLETINVDSNNPMYEDRNSNVIIEKSTNTLLSGCKNSVIPNDIKIIGPYAFEGAYLTNAIIPNGVISLGNGAFKNCSKLTSINIPNSITRIDYNVFSGCSSLKNIIIPDSVTSIGGSAFYGCSSLENIVIPDSVTELGNMAFGRCSSLKSITLSKNITTIGNGMFTGCSSLESITIPASVTNIITDGIFSDCSNLATIKVDPNNPVYEDRNSNAIIEKSTNKLILGCKNTVIPNSVTSIGAGAFTGIVSLKNITIPASVTSIQNNPFQRCNGLETIKVNSNNPKYEDRNSNAIIEKSTNTLLTGCKNTIIPNNIRIIGKSAFNGSKFKSITIPNSVTKIGESAFLNCSSLTSITFENKAGWKIYFPYSSNDAGTSIDVSDSAANAVNLTTKYNYYDIKRGN